MYFAVPDEEAGGTWGARWMVDNHWDDIACDYLLTELAGVAMPTADGPRITITVAEKGIAWRRLRVTGRPGHGSMPYGADNAVVKAAAIVQRLDAHRPRSGLGQVWRDTVAWYEFDDELVRRACSTLWRCSMLWRTSPIRGPPPCSARAVTRPSRRTCVHGGIKSNVIPDTVDIDVDIRTLPGVTGGDVDGYLRDSARRSGRRGRRQPRARRRVAIGLRQCGRRCGTLLTSGRRPCSPVPRRSGRS